VLLKKRRQFYKHHFATGHAITSKSSGLLKTYEQHLNLSETQHMLVIGSGSGLIPMFFAELFNEGQGSTVTLIDAGLPTAGFGHPWGEEGWAYENSDLFQFYPHIILILTTSDKGLEYLNRNEKRYHLIFIDANHSESFVYSDIEKSVLLLATRGVIILHDSNLISVQNAVNKFLFKNKGFKQIEKNFSGAGAIVIGRNK
jgi:hypothetical protein